MGDNCTCEMKAVIGERDLIEKWNKRYVPNDPLQNFDDPYEKGLADGYMKGYVEGREDGFNSILRPKQHLTKWQLFKRLIGIGK
jgi:flagellar biosynthesis/type III secretory pathway protein FliH